MEEQAKRGPGRPRNDDRTRDDSGTRRERVPLGVVRRKLSFRNQDPNFQYRWMKDKDNRINEALDGGYEFVERDSGTAGDDSTSDQGQDTRISKVTGSTERGDSQRSYLMRIRKDWYEQDQAEKQKYLDEIEQQITRGVDGQGRPGVDGRYIPTSGTNIEKG